MSILQSDIKYLSGVGPQRAELLLKELEIRTVEDLISYFPYKYVDRSKFYKIKDIASTSAYIQIKGRILSFSTVGEGKNKRMVALFSDGESAIELVFFKGLQFIKSAYAINKEYVVFGKPSCFNGKYNFVHPDIEVPGGDETLSFMPVYHTTEKMKNRFLNSKVIQKLVYTALLQIKREQMEETLPPYILQKYGFMDIFSAFAQIHFPQNLDLLDKAKFRLKYEELFYIQLSILRRTGALKKKLNGHSFATVGDYFNTFYKDHLPFELTAAQKRVIKEIRQDMKGLSQMNRLLQGDVGSGKTMVALLIMLIALDNHYQACLVAPTEILATQHYESLSQILKGLPIKIALLKGSTKKKDRDVLHRELQDGTMQVLIGTHAVFEDVVQFKNLGLVIIDEQHRFGVAQRAKLWAKNEVRPPHVLVMTATPIPRTLAMTVYGDLDVSVIDELPAGRKPIETYHFFESKRANVLRFMRQQLSLGRQIYVVYPLIEESEKSDLKNLQEGYEYLSETFKDIEIGMVHGKMKPKDKDYQMQLFLNKETRILVATTVIEVGVNVPNASVMIIENAERFGLAQLHQLRGRVGRGADQSYCVLMTKYELSADSRKRINIMVETTDGFKIAEEDLLLRGPGEMDGTLQSGLPFKLHIADLSHDSLYLTKAREDVKQILEDDLELNKPENYVLKKQLAHRSKGVVNWSVIS